MLLLATLLLASPLARAQPSDVLNGRLLALIPAKITQTEVFRPVAPLAGCAVRTLPAATSPLSAPLREGLDQAQRYSDAQNGVGLIVVHDGKVIHERYAQGFGPDTLTASQSMMKSVTGLAVGIALDRRMIASIDDPVGRYLSEWAGDPRGAITLRQLLTMTSGLDHPPIASDAFKRLYVGDDITAQALALPSIEQPGASFDYSNANSQLLGAVVQRVARQRGGFADFAAFLRAALWCPLGNADAQLWLDHSGKAPHYYAGLHARLADWARIGELIRLGGRAGGRQVVSRAWLRAMTAPSAANPAYGLHIWRGTPWKPYRDYGKDSPMTVPHSAAYLADDVLFFDGFGGQRVYIVPSRRLTIARTGNTSLAYDDAIIVNAVLAGLGAMR